MTLRSGIFPIRDVGSGSDVEAVPGFRGLHEIHADPNSLRSVRVVEDAVLDVAAVA